MISHQSDYDDEEDGNGTGGDQYEEDDFQDSESPAHNTERKRQVAIKTLQNHLSN